MSCLQRVNKAERHNRQRMSLRKKKRRESMQHKCRRPAHLPPFLPLCSLYNPVCLYRRS